VPKTLRDVNAFAKQKQVGQGTYGYVLLDFFTVLVLSQSLLTRFMPSLFSIIIIFVVACLFHFRIAAVYLSCCRCNERSVFSGKDKQTKDIVALKRINTEQEANGFPITAIREVKILKALHHANIVQLKELVTSKGALFNFLLLDDGLLMPARICGSC
jgi:serine/threonine protein kinase